MLAETNFFKNMNNMKLFKDKEKANDIKIIRRILKNNVYIKKAK